MPPTKAERPVPGIIDPRPLGVENDPGIVEMFEDFAKDRDIREVYELWKDPEITNPALRQQIIIYLTAPYDYDASVTRSRYRPGVLSLHEEINGKSTHSIRKRLADRPELTQELTQGYLYWLDNLNEQDKASEADASHYQAAILELLPMVDEETADRLFAHYPYKATEPSQYDHRPAEGYDPMVELLKDQGIPKRYKDTALAWLFETADKEERGLAEPRTEHERAINVIAELIYRLPISRPNKTIVTTLVRFLEKIHPAEASYAKDFAISDIAKKITNPRLRFEFACRHILKSRSRFCIEGEESLALVTWIWEEAQERGITEFNQKIETLVERYRLEKQEKIARQAAEVAIVAELRKL